MSVECLWAKRDVEKDECNVAGNSKREWGWLRQGFVRVSGKNAVARAAVDRVAFGQIILLGRGRENKVK